MPGHDAQLAGDKLSSQLLNDFVISQPGRAAAAKVIGQHLAQGPHAGSVEQKSAQKLKGVEQVVKLSYRFRIRIITPVSDFKRIRTL